MGKNFDISLTEDEFKELVTRHIDLLNSTECMELNDKQINKIVAELSIVLYDEIIQPLKEQSEKRYNEYVRADVYGRKYEHQKTENKNLKKQNEYLATRVQELLAPGSKKVYPEPPANTYNVHQLDEIQIINVINLASKCLYGVENITDIQRDKDGVRIYIADEATFAINNNLDVMSTRGYPDEEDEGTTEFVAVRTYNHALVTDLLRSYLSQKEPFITIDKEAK